MGLQAAEPTAEEHYLQLFENEHWREAEELANSQLKNDPRSGLWYGYLAAIEFRVQRWELVVEDLARMRLCGGALDRNQLGLEWEASIRLELYPHAVRLFTEIRRRYPTSTLATYADALAKGTPPEPMTNEQEEGLARLYRRMDDAMKQVSQGGEMLVRLRHYYLTTRRTGLLGLALASGQSYLTIEKATGAEPQLAQSIRLMMASDAMDEGDLMLAGDLLAVIPRDFNNYEATLFAARLALLHGKTADAISLAQSAFDLTTDLSVRGRARQIKDLKNQAGAQAPGK